MELVIMILVAVAILAYYGFMKSVETAAGMANREVSHLEDQHLISILERKAKLGSRINDDTVKAATEADALLATLKAS